MKTAVLGLALLGPVACLDFQPPPDALTLLAVEPAQVAPEGAVTLVFSAPLKALPMLIVDLEGMSVPVQARLEVDRIILTPLNAWPQPGRLAVRSVEPIYGRDGGGLDSAGEVLGWFSVKDEARSDQPLTLLGPWAGPANLRYLLLAGPEAAFSEQSSIRLTGYGEPATGRVLAHAEGRALVEVGAAPPCEAICEARSYGVQVMPQDLEVGQVLTSSIVDRTAPSVLWVNAVARGATIRVQVFGDEAVVVQGKLHPPEGPPVDLTPPQQIDSEVWLSASQGLLPSTRYRVVLNVWDVAGNSARAPVVYVETADVPRARITEVVASPLRDWSDREGVPFDAWPGVGPVNDNDEWVEIVNLSDRSVDVLKAGLELHALDTSPSVTPIAGAPGLFFSSGGGLHDWRPGEAMVVRVRGSLSQRELRLELIGSGALLDSMSLGASGLADHGGGAPPDTVHEAIAKDASGVWAWCVPTPGDPGFNPECL